MILSRKALALLLFPAILTAQAPPSDVHRAVVRWVFVSQARQTISIDPRIMEASPGFPRATTKLHASELLSAINVPDTGRVVSAALAESCDPPKAAECMSGNTAHFLMFGTPTVSGDSATVEIAIRSARVPAAADSARLRQFYLAQQRIDSVVPARFDTLVLFSRAANATIVRYSVRLLRTPGGWGVVSAVVLGSGGALQPMLGS